MKTFNKSTKAIGIPLCLFCIFFLAATSCKNTPTGAKNAENLTQSPLQTLGKNTPSLVFETKEDSFGTPQTQVFWQFDNRNGKVLDIAGSVVEMNSAERKQNEIPATAVFAASGFWGGLQTLLIVESANDTAWVVKRKYQDAESDENDKEIFEVVQYFK
jgi:hypothetical protein